MSDPIRDLLDKQAITEVLYRYCRSLDRMDKAAAQRIWHPGGTADYDTLFQGTGAGFVDWVWKSHAAMQMHSHQISNVLIELDGDRARSEAYVTVALRTHPRADGSVDQITSRGRYLDRWSRRDGVWGIDHRVHVMDLTTTLSLPGAAATPPSPRATRDAGDASRGFFRAG